MRMKQTTTKRTCQRTQTCVTDSLLSSQKPDREDLGSLQLWLETGKSGGDIERPPYVI